MESKLPEEEQPETLADLIKGLEAATDTKLNPDLPYVVRLDGHGFSKFTRGFKRPVDERITYAMTMTAQDLLMEFNAVLAYTQSDEISLVFPAVDRERKQTPLYSGRIQKIVSLAASFAATRFNFHLRTAFPTLPSPPKEKEVRKSNLEHIMSAIEKINSHLPLEERRKVVGEYLQRYVVGADDFDRYLKGIDSFDELARALSAAKAGEPTVSRPPSLMIYPLPLGELNGSRPPPS